MCIHACILHHLNLDCSVKINSLSNNREPTQRQTIPRYTIDLVTNQGPLLLTLLLMRYHSLNNRHSVKNVKFKSYQKCSKHNNFSQNCYFCIQFILFLAPRYSFKCQSNFLIPENIHELTLSHTSFFKFKPC